MKLEKIKIKIGKYLTAFFEYDHLSISVQHAFIRGHMEHMCPCVRVCVCVCMCVRACVRAYTRANSLSHTHKQ